MFELSNPVLIAFGLTLFAGLSTGIGSALAFFTKRTNTKFLSLILGFSAGIMLYISFIEIFPEARNIISEVYGIRIGTLIAVIAFFAGIIIIALIDKLVPSFENPHEIRKIEVMKNKKDVSEELFEECKCKKLMRCGICTAIAIIIHNIPEGIITFTSAFNDFKLGIVIAIAIAIHNIPEGIAVSIPIFYATGSRKKAFIYSFLSGFSEFIGAFVGFFLLSLFLNSIALGIMMSSVAGIMVFISLDQLLPTAEEYGEHHLAIYGLIIGMAVMALSLFMFL